MSCCRGFYLAGLVFAVEKSVGLPFTVWRMAFAWFSEPAGHSLTTGVGLYLLDPENVVICGLGTGLVRNGTGWRSAVVWYAVGRAGIIGWKYTRQVLVHTLLLLDNVLVPDIE